MSASNKLVIYDDVNFIKQGWINRNRVLVNGQPTFLTLPLENGRSSVQIRDVRLSKGADWKAKILKTISLAYRRAPNFDVTYSMIERVLGCQSDLVKDVAYESLNVVASYLDLTCVIERSSQVYNNDALSGQERIIDICLKEGAAEYLNLPGGKELYDRPAFNSKNIDLKFLVPTEWQYCQWSKSSFVPNLSIVDSLMFNTKDQIQEFLSKSAFI